jgi:hypothetical protein
MRILNRLMGGPVSPGTHHFGNLGYRKELIKNRRRTPDHLTAGGDSSLDNGTPASEGAPLSF